jgi:hypothetical protein
MRRKTKIDQQQLEKAITSAALANVAQQLSEQGLKIAGPVAMNVRLIGGSLSLLWEDGVETVELQQDRVEETR